MFKVNPTPRFTHDVPVMVPADGGHEEQSLKVTFNLVPEEELKDFDTSTDEGFLAWLRRIVHRLDDLADEGGAPVSYTEELRDELLRWPFVRLALARGYQRAVVKAKAGN